MRTVADAHRPRIAEPTPVAELLFPELGAAVHVVQHTQLRPGEARRVQHPVEECARLVEIAETGERAHRERGVPQPAVAVIPVAIRAKRFGKRRGRCRNHGPGERVGEQLERQCAANDCVAIGSRVSRLRAPPAPPAQSVLDALLRCHAERRYDADVGLRIRERAAQPIPRCHHVLTDQALAARAEDHVRVQVKALASPDPRPLPRGTRAEARHGQAVAWTWIDLERHRDAPFDARYDPEDLAHRLELALVRKRHQVENAHRSIVRAERGLEHI